MMLPIIMSGYFPDGEIGEARLEYVTEAISSIHYYAHMYPRDDHYEIFVAHDGPENRNTAKFHEMWDWHARVHIICSEQHNGVGASLNNALRVLNPEVWMYTTDDFCLRHHLNLIQGLTLIEAGYDYVRLGPLHPNIHCQVKFAVNLGWFLELKTTHGYIVATRPFLMTKAMTDKLAEYNQYWGYSNGPFMEGATSYDVEIALNNAAIEIYDYADDKPFAALLSDGTEW